MAEGSTVGWLIGFGGSAVTAATFLAVAVALAASLTKTRQWRANPLGVGTFFLFLTCGGGHFIHTLQLLYLTLSIDTAAAVAARVEYGDWHIWAADGATAVAGVLYWTMRGAFPSLVTGTAVYEDLRERHARALEIHDNVVQGLAKAKLAADLGQDDISRLEIERTLDVSEAIVRNMAEDSRAGAAPGGGSRGRV